jgi:hypothetical protein
VLRADSPYFEGRDKGFGATIGVGWQLSKYFQTGLSFIYGHTDGNGGDSKHLIIALSILKTSF